RSTADGLGAGLAVDTGSAVSVARSVFLANERAGVDVSGKTTTFTMTDSTVEGSVVDVAKHGGWGIYTSRATTELDGVAIVGNHGSGMDAAVPELTASGILVEGTVATPDDFGNGITIESFPGKANITGAAILKNEGAGI